jgi:bifunctional UDP-N-acetylglucosamine pyrophosphorylase/glucosamine-1-phosphate N-acetyltransferase
MAKPPSLRPEDIRVIVLAGGKSSRFWPLAQNQHKLMTPLMGKPVLEHTLLSVARARVKRVTLVVNADQEAAMRQRFQDGQALGLTLSYARQQESLGQADAILAAAKALTTESVVLVINGEQVNAHEFIKPILKFKAQEKAEVVLAARKTNKPWKYGIFKLDGKQAVGMVEKPKPGEEPSKIRAIGVYCLSREFLQFLRDQSQEEYQLEATLDRYMQQGKVQVWVCDLASPSLKFPWDLFRIRDYLFKELSHSISAQAHLAKTAVIKPPVVIEAGALVGEFALVEGPAYIGPKAVLGAYSILRGGSALEQEAEAQRYADVKNSLLLPQAQIHSGFVGDSILGEGCSAGAGLITANLRLDRKPISCLVKGEKVSTGRRYFGAVIGPLARLGVRVTLMPGRLIGARSQVYPGVVVMNNVPDGTIERP